MADPPELHLKDLKAISILGRGAKGLVFLVDYSPSQSNSTTTHLALKVIPTALRLTRSSSSSSRDDEADHRRRIILERDILSSLHHPLLPSLRGLVSTDHIVGFAIDYCPGGNLSSLRRRQSEQMFSEDAIRFYAAELVLALEHLHGLGIVYRDLKPENILIKSDGHLMVVDFDLSTRIPTTNQPHWRAHSWGSEKSISTWSLSSSSTSSLSSSSTKSNSFVGTEEYLAPEMVEGRGHGFAVDWWGLGVVLYEMLYGRTPFRGRDRRETFHMIVTREPSLVGERTPLRDLLARLLEKDPNRRIGVEAIKTHDFFGGLDWRFVVDVARPPFIPLSLQEEEEDDEEEPIAGGGRCEIDIEKCVGMVFEGRNVDASPLFQVF